MTESRAWPLITPVSTDRVLIHHVSDTHFGYRPWSYAEGDHLLDDLRKGLVPLPDLFIHTGDIVDGTASQVDTRTEDAYALAWLDAAAFKQPALWAMGNHDVRDRTVHTRAQWKAIYGHSANRFVDVGGIRFITFTVDSFSGLDSLWTVPAATWEWVAAVASTALGPVVLVSHYPPTELGGVIPENALLPQATLNDLIGDVPAIMGMMCGHMHKDLSDLDAASFVTLGGRAIPLLTDLSAMLSLEGQPGRDYSGRIESKTAYVEMLPDLWRVHYRRHGGHMWGGPDGQRVTTMDLVTGTVTRGMA